MWQNSEILYTQEVLEVAERELDVKESHGQEQGMSQQPPGEPITEDQMARWTPRGRPAWMMSDPKDQMSPPIHGTV